MDAVVISRPSKWGNPWKVVKVGVALGRVEPDGQESGVVPYSAAVGIAVDLFGEYLDSDEGRELKEAARLELVGKDLACWCPPGQRCHGDVLLEVANQGR